MHPDTRQPPRSEGVGGRPWVVWWFGELSGSRSRADEAEGFRSLEAVPIRTAAEVESLLRSVAPEVQVRFEDLSSPGELAEASLRLASMADFGDAEIERRVPAVSRCRSRSGGPDAVGPVETGGGDLARLIARALQGGASAPAADGTASGSSHDLPIRQIDLIRGDDAFGRIERSWRSLARLAAAAEEAGCVEIRVLDVADQSVRRALAALDRGHDATLVDRCEDLLATVVHRPELVVIDAGFGMDTAGFEAMRGLATLSSILGAPVLFGCGHEAFADVDSAGGIDRILREPMMAAFRTLRQAPASASVVAAIPPIRRKREGSAGDWIQGAGAALAEALVAALGPAGSSHGLGPLSAGPGMPAARFGAATADAFVRHGIATIFEDPQAPGRLSTAATVPTVRAGPADADPRAAEVRIPMVVARVAKSLALEARSRDRPSNDPASLASFASDLAGALPKDDLRLLGVAPAGPLEAEAPVSLAVRYESSDERKFSILLDLRASKSRWIGASLARAATFPLA